MWPQEYIELKHIENLLACGICYELMDTSVITSCSHSYCSLCIRKYLHYKTQCPACFAETFEKDLRKNKLVDEIIIQFSQVKDKLKRCLQIQIQFGQCSDNSKVNVTPNSLPQSKNGCQRDEKPKAGSSACASGLENNVTPLINALNDIASPSISGKSKVPLMFTPKSTKNRIIQNVEDTKVVTCPICKVAISELNINRHLDDCLKRELQEKEPQVIESTRKPLPKLVFSLMKDAVIKKKLKEFGLSAQGDRKTLEARLQKYIVLYNAECDKLHPRPIAELIKQCQDEENVEKKTNKACFKNKLQVTRHTEQNIIDEERRKYLQANKDSFNTLIRKIRNRRSTKKSLVRRNLLNESVENDECTPCKRQALDETLVESVTEQSNIESTKPIIYIQDSDSETSCPLQIYCQSGSEKFLNVELSPSKSSLLKNLECETDKCENVGLEKYNINYSPLKVNGTEEEYISDTCSNASDFEEEAKLVIKSSFHQSTLKEYSSSTPKLRMLEEGKEKLFVKHERKRRDSDTDSTADFCCDRNVDQDEENKTSTSGLQDILHNVQVNDSNETVFNSGKLPPTNFGTLDNKPIETSNLGKENAITCSPKISENDSPRKRSRNSAQTDKKCTMPSTKNKSNVDESSSTTTDRDGDISEKKPRQRKRLMNNRAESSTGLRKSARTKVKNNP